MVLCLTRVNTFPKDFLVGIESREWVDWCRLRARGFRNKNVDTKRESLSNPGMKEPTHIIIQNSMPPHSGMPVKHPVHGRLILVKRAGGDSWHCRKRDDTSGNLTILRPKEWKPDFGG